MALEALIFDVDGTLADTEREGHRVAFNQAFEALGLGWCWSAALYGELLQVAGGKERLQFFIEQFSPPLPQVSDRRAWIATIHQEKTRRYAALLDAGKIPLRPGVRRLITEARARGLRLAISTTTHPENVQALLVNTLGVDAPQWFEVIAAGDVVPDKKPDPGIYRYVLERMNLSPEAALALEDSEHGLAAAIAAGLKTVITQTEYTQNQDFSAASLVLDHLGEPQHPCQVLRGRPLPQGYFDCAIATTLCLVL